MVCPCSIDALLLNVGDDLLGDVLGNVGVRIRQQDRELIAAEPGDRVGAAQAVAEQRGDRHDQAVSGLVAEGVVDGLEVVEVEHEQRAAVAIAIDVRHVAFEFCLEAAAIQQARERVMVGHVAQLALHRAPLCDVHKVAQDLHRVAVVVAQHAHMARDPDRFTVCAQQPTVADVAVDLAANQLGVQQGALLELLGVSDRGQVHGEQLVAGVAGDVAHRVR